VRSAQRNGRISRSARLAACMLLATAVVLANFADFASAQTTITVAPTVPVAPAVEVPFPIRVGPLNALPKGSFVRVRGLPPMAALSDGYSIAPGSWAIPISALPGLKITLPEAAVGRSEILIMLVSIDGSVLAEAKSSVIVAATPPLADTTAKSAPVSVPKANAPAQKLLEQVERPGTSLTAEERERAQHLVRKGHEQLSAGGIAQARLLYERAADAGFAPGAMAMAATFDAAELDRLGLAALKPDREAARRWYERARQLGAADAEQRLRRLGAN
jgi:hypothetical protein